MIKSISKIIFLIGLMAVTNVILPMYRYNDVKTCEVCYADHDRNEYLRLGCGHSMCPSCVHNIVEIAVKEKTMLHFHCAERRCLRKITLPDLQNLRISQTKVAQLQNIMRPQKADMGDLDSETKSWLNSNSKPCPKCLAPIERNEGCNHMTCRHCTHQFCWLCLVDWRYSHGCPLFGTREESANRRQQFERSFAYRTASRSSSLINRVIVPLGLLAILVYLYAENRQPSTRRF